MAQLSESRLVGMVSECVKQVLTELDWKTYMNASRKAYERGEYERAEKFADAARKEFGDKYGLDTFVGADEPFLPDSGYNLGYDLEGGASNYRGGRFREPFTSYMNQYDDGMESLFDPHYLHYNGTKYYSPEIELGWYANPENFGSVDRPDMFDKLLSPDDLEKVKSGDQDLSAYRNGRAKYSPEKGWHVEEHRKTGK